MVFGILGKMVAKNAVVMPILQLEEDAIKKLVNVNVCLESLDKIVIIVPYIGF